MQSYGYKILWGISRREIKRERESERRRRKIERE
jgi:hypothetical protein